MITNSTRRFSATLRRVVGGNRSPRAKAQRLQPRLFDTVLDQPALDAARPTLRQIAVHLRRAAVVGVAFDRHLLDLWRGLDHVGHRLQDG